MIGLLTLCIGCDAAPQGPRTKAKTDTDLNSDLGAGKARGTKIIAVILTENDTAETQIWDRAARLSLSKYSWYYDAYHSKTGKQPESLARAIASKPAMILVVPELGKEAALSQPLALAQSQGIPVLTIHRDVPTPAPTEKPADAKPADASSATPERFPVVRFPKYGPEAEFLVKALVDYAKKAKFATDKEWMILGAEGQDNDVPLRIAAVQSALKSAGLGQAKEVRYKGTSRDAELVVMNAAQENKNLLYVVTVDDESFDGALQTRYKLKQKEHPLVAGGYTIFLDGLPYVDSGRSSGVVQMTPGRLMDTAIELSRQAFAGKPIPPNTLVQPILKAGDPSVDLEPHGPSTDTPEKDFRDQKPRVNRTTP